MRPKACPPFQLFQDELGRRCLPLVSLRHVLEWQLSAAPEEASLERLLEAVTAAEEVPLPGLTPSRAADVYPGGEIPGLVLAEPANVDGALFHPGADAGDQ